MPHRFKLICPVLIVTLFVVSLCAEDFRTWTDVSGSFKISAAFVQLKGGKVYLRKEDGSIIPVPLDRLSRADQKYAQRTGKSFSAPPPTAPTSPSLAKFRAIRGRATIVLTDGERIRCELLSMKPSLVRIKVNGRRRVLGASVIKEVEVDDDTLFYDSKMKTFVSQKEAAEAARKRQLKLAEEARKRRILEEQARSGRVKVVNQTNKLVQFFIMRMRDPEGDEVVLDSGRSKPQIQQIADAIGPLLNSLDNSIHVGNEPVVINGRGTRTALSWDIGPQQTVDLKWNGKYVVTSKVGYKLVTTDGSKTWEAEKSDGSEKFLILINEGDLHSPLLVNIGKWHVEQDVWYTTRRARTPTRIEPVRGFFSGEIKHYEVWGGEEYEYEQENRAGTATAWTEIENPTAKTLDVTATVEFHFNHLLLSHERVNATITVKPRTKTKMYITVNTKGFLENRKAVSVTQIDVSTTPRR